MIPIQKLTMYLYIKINICSGNQLEGISLSPPIPLDANLVAM